MATKAIKLAAAIREALNKGHEETGKIRDYINTSYPYLKDKTDKAGFNSSLSQERKKFKGSGDGADAGTTAETPAAVATGTEQEEATVFAQVDEAQKKLNKPPAEGFDQFYSAFRELKGLVARVGKEEVRKMLDLM